MDNDGAGSIRLLWMIVPDIDLVAVRWGNVVWVLAPYEYAGIDSLTRIEFQVEFKVIPGCPGHQESSTLGIGADQLPVDIFPVSVPKHYPVLKLAISV